MGTYHEIRLEGDRRLDPIGIGSSCVMISDEFQEVLIRTLNSPPMTAPPGMIAVEG